MRFALNFAQRFALACLAMLVTVLASQAQAVTPAGTLIDASSRAYYFDPDSGARWQAWSNMARVRVTGIARMTLAPDRTLYLRPGEEAQFTHLLTNTGNTPVRAVIRMEAVNGLEFPLINPRNFIDADHDGIARAGEVLAGPTPILLPGESFDLVMSARVPDDGRNGQRGGMVLHVDLLPEIRDAVVETPTLRVRDEAHIRIGEGFGIAVSTNRVCTAPLDPGALTRVDVALLSPDELTEAPQSFRIDGHSFTGHVVTTRLPGGMRFGLERPTLVLPDRAAAIYRLDGAAPDEYVTAESWDGVGEIREFGIAMTDMRFRDPVRKSYSFWVAIADDATQGTRLNLGADWRGQGAQISATPACVTVTDGPTGGAPADIRFMRIDRMSGAMVPALFYRIAREGANFSADTMQDYQLWLEMNTTQLNLNGELAETHYADQPIIVSLRDQVTGDSVRLTMRETGPDTGVFRSMVPVYLRLDAAGGNKLCAPGMTGMCFLKSGANHVLFASYVNDTVAVSVSAEALVDPLGVVFDSLNGRPIAGAVVSVRDRTGALARDPDTGGATVLAPQTTGVDGRFHYPRLYPGDYYLSIDSLPATHQFPSIGHPDALAAYGTVGRWSYGRDGYPRIPDFGVFSLGAGDPPLVVDIPVDPTSRTTQLGIDKRADRSVAMIGDVVRYTVTLRNLADVRANLVRLRDSAPLGFAFVAGSARMDGAPLADPVFENQSDFVFDIGDLAIGQQRVITYAMRVGAGAQPGKAVNSAQALGESGARVPMGSGVARATVTLRKDGVLGTEALLIGAVLAVPEAGCALPSGAADLEATIYGPAWPVAGARLLLSDGAQITTDARGQWSLPGQQPGRRALRLDPLSIPKGAVPRVLGVDNAQRGDSLIMDLAEGTMPRADFVLDLPCAVVAEAWQAIKAARAALPEAGIEEARFEGLLGQSDISRVAMRDRMSGSGFDASTGTMATSQGRSRAETPNKATAMENGAADNGRVAANTVGAAKPSTPQPMRLVPDTNALAGRATLADATSGAMLWPNDGVLRGGRVSLAMPMGADGIELRLNGAVVPQKQLGEIVVNRGTKAQVASWYGLDPAAGQNQLELFIRDSFGNARLLASHSLTRPGLASKLHLTPIGRAEAGQTAPAEVLVLLTDNTGVAVDGLEFATVTLDQGSFADADAQPNEPGWQLRLQDGRGVLRINTPQVTGQIRMRASLANGLEASRVLEIGAEARPLIGVGFVELVGQVALGSDPHSVGHVDVEGRGQLFLKGRIRGDMLLTLSYDSERGRNTQLLRDIDPDAWYPVYGDDARRDYEGQARSPLYVRLERGPALVMWGDYVADRNSDFELDRMNRVLTGAALRWQQDGLKIEGFAAQPTEVEQVVRLRGRGLALGYAVPAPLLAGSEVVVIETRSRTNPGLVLRERSLTRHVDYRLNPDTGVLDLAEALASSDAEGNPLFLRVSYQMEGDGEPHLVAGARAEWSPDPQAQLGLAITHDAHPQQGADVATAYAKGSLLEGKVQLRADVATSRDINDAVGHAVQVQLQARPDPDQTIEARYGRVDEAYAGQGRLSDGREEAQVEARVIALGQAFVLKGSHSADLSDEGSLSQFTIGARFAGEAIGLDGVELTPMLGFQAVETSTERAEHPLVGLRIAHGFTVWDMPMRNYAELRHALDDTAWNIELGTEVKLADRARAYIRQEVARGLASDAPGMSLGSSSSFGGPIGSIGLSDGVLHRDATALGIETEITTGTRGFAEGDLGAGDGVRLGLRGDYLIAAGVQLRPSLELFHDQESGQGMALSVGVVDRGPDHRRSLRAEARAEDERQNYGLRAAWAERFDPALTGFAQLAGRLEEGTRDRMHKASAVLGVAYRPADLGHHALGYIQLADEKLSDGDSERALIAATHQTLAWENGVRLHGRAGLKWAERSISDTSDRALLALVGGQLSWPLTTEWALDLRAGVLGVNGDDSVSYAYGLGFSYSPMPDVRLGLGYNVKGFEEAHLAPQNYFRPGLNFNVTLRASEGLFGWLMPEDNRTEHAPRPLPGLPPFPAEPGPSPAVPVSAMVAVSRPTVASPPLIGTESP